MCFGILLKASNKIRGTYLYVCDPNLKEYLSKYIDKYNGSGINYTIEEKEDENILMVAEESEGYRLDKK